MEHIANDPILLVSLLILGGLIAAVLIIYRPRAVRSQTHDALVRIQQRLDDQVRFAETRARTAEQLLHDHERLRRDDQSKLLRELERRLGELMTAQAQAAAELRASLVERFERLQREVLNQLTDGRTHTIRSLGELREQTSNTLGMHQTRFEQRQSDAQKNLQDSLHKGIQAVHRQVTDALARSAEDLGKRVEGLTRTTDERLKDISGQVEKRLAEGFEKTTATFNDVLKRLALIDKAQQKITELSSDVVSLQQVLADKRSRGAFGEVQLHALVDNVMPASSYALQHTLSNGKRADCVLFLPQPTGTIAIDAKFPLESYQRMTDLEVSEIERKNAERTFKQDIRKHIKDISERYIVPNETSDGAIMFVPAEAVFAEIQAHHPDVVQQAHRARVWMASPTTLVAILNTARAVLKDEATRKQIHVIRRHLSELARDFDRFRDRMDKLAMHIDQANRDVMQVNTSAKKISTRFETIEKVEMEGEPAPALDQEPTLEPEAPNGGTSEDATESG